MPELAPQPAHTATQRLLVAELDAARFGDPRYLAWQYDENPRGEAIQEHEDDERGTRVGHYAVVPTRFRTKDGPCRFIFSSNVATDSTTRRSGLFRTMAARMYERAAASGAPAMVGVGNDASTVVVVERFGWRKLRPMGARVVAPLAWRAARAVESARVTPELLASPRFAEVTDDLDWVPVDGWAQSWDTEFVRWRLSRPDGGYALHVAPDAIAVTVRAPAPLHVPTTVLLKVWPRRGARLPVRTGGLVTAACRHHRTPFCVYAGWNRHAVVRGIRVPQRAQPSPLNVVLKVLDDSVVDAATFSLDTWELLDMDAY